MPPPLAETKIGLDFEPFILTEDLKYKLLFSNKTNSDPSSIMTGFSNAMF